MPNREPRQKPKKNKIGNIVLLEIEAEIDPSNSIIPIHKFAKKYSQKIHDLPRQLNAIQGSPSDRKREIQAKNGIKKPMPNEAKNLVKKLSMSEFST